MIARDDIAVIAALLASLPRSRIAARAARTKPSPALDHASSRAAIEIRHHASRTRSRCSAPPPTATRSTCAPQAKFTSADPKVATVDDRLGPPGRQRADAGHGHRRRARRRPSPVKVQLPAAEPPISFRHEVMPVLSQAGCNAGACHGYSLGKNGFKLSLRGADPEPDYFAITKEFAGRRVNFQSPDASLLVAKPRGDVAARGRRALRAATACRDDILVDWIAQGAPGDLTDTAQVVGVRLVPDKLVLRPGPEAPPAAHRRVHRRHDARRDPARRLHRQQRRSSPTSTTRAS